MQRHKRQMEALTSGLRELSRLIVVVPPHTHTGSPSNQEEHRRGGTFLRNRGSGGCLYVETAWGTKGRMFALLYLRISSGKVGRKT